MILGAHVRRHGHGVEGVVRGCRERGADCAQVFISNPRAWAPPSFADEEAAACRSDWLASGLGPLVAHAPYVVNVAAADPEVLRRSRGLLRRTVETAGALGVSIVVVHSGAAGTGSAVDGRRRAATSLREAVGAAPPGVTVAVELMAGTSGAVASSLQEAVSLLDEVDDDRLAICLDTCHLFAAGYGLDTADGVIAFGETLLATGLFRRLALVHANDSVFGRGEHRDRHAYLGDGPLEWPALTHSALARVPWITETPGDPDRQRRDLAMLRAVANVR